MFGTMSGLYLRSTIGRTQYIRIYIYTHTYTHTCMCIYSSTHVRHHVRLIPPLHNRKNTICIYTYIHIHIYIHMYILVYMYDTLPVFSRRSCCRPFPNNRSLRTCNAYVNLHENQHFGAFTPLNIAMYICTLDRLFVPSLGS